MNCWLLSMLVNYWDSVRLSKSGRPQLFVLQWFCACLVVDPISCSATCNVGWGKTRQANIRHPVTFDDMTSSAVLPASVDWPWQHPVVVLIVLFLMVRFTTFQHTLHQMLPLVLFVINVFLLVVFLAFAGAYVGAIPVVFVSCCGCFCTVDQFIHICSIGI